MLIESRRWQIGGPLLELPAGTLEPGEDPGSAAARELTEETGYRAGRLEPWGAAFALPGITTEVMHLFRATDLAPGPQALEADEHLEVVCLSRAEVRRRLLAGEFQDLKTQAALGRWLLEGVGAAAAAPG